MHDTIFSYPGGDELTLSSEDEVNNTSPFSPPQQEAAIRLPASLFESIQYRDNIGIFFALYDQPTLFPVSTSDDSSARSQIQVGSLVISSTVGGDNFFIENLSEPVIVTLKIVKVSM